MRWSIVALGLVGLIAAGAAAFLVAGLRTSRAAVPGIAAPQAGVLFATKSMPALSVVEAGSVVLRTVPLSEAPPNAMSDPVTVVGKVLRHPVVAGQAITPAVLAAKDSAINLAAAVREGMRAVSVSLADYEALQGLLYPGSVVDVLFSFKAPAGSKDQADETVSTTLLRAVQVLAIENRTILSPAEGGDVPTTATRGTQHQMVTLMVSPKQAELLQLAQKFGSITLSMRNPLDADPGGRGETLLSQMSEFLKKRVAPAVVPAALAAPAPASQPAANLWQVRVIRGGATEMQNVSLPTAVEKS